MDACSNKAGHAPLVLSCTLPHLAKPNYLVAPYLIGLEKTGRLPTAFMRAHQEQDLFAEAPRQLSCSKVVAPSFEPLVT